MAAALSLAVRPPTYLLTAGRSPHLTSTPGLLTGLWRAGPTAGPLIRCTRGRALLGIRPLVDQVNLADCGEELLEEDTRLRKLPSHKKQETLVHGAGSSCSGITVRSAPQALKHTILRSAVEDARKVAVRTQVGPPVRAVTKWCTNSICNVDGP